MQHLALKDKTTHTHKKSLTDQDYPRGGRSNFKTRASWQYGKKKCFGSFTTVGFFALSKENVFDQLCH